MTPDQRQSLREKARAATPGPWMADNAEVLYDGTPGCAWGVRASDIYVVLHDFIAPRNAVYVAAASPDVLLALLDALDTQEQENARLQHLVESMDAEMRGLY